MLQISNFFKKSFPVLLLILIVSCSSDNTVLADEIIFAEENTAPVVDTTETGSDTNDTDNSTETDSDTDTSDTGTDTDGDTDTTDNGTDTDTDTDSGGNTDTNDTTSGNAFISVWTLSDRNKTITLPIYSGNTSYDFTVDWGDNTTGVVTSFDDADKSHTYADAGEKTVTIMGTLKGFNFLENGDSSELLTSITDWGDLHFGFEDGIFWDCENLTSLPDASPDLTGITKLKFYFHKCASFVGPVKNWEVSNITDFQGTFSRAELFNDDISGWDVSSANNFESMFASAASFNQDISGWDVSNGIEYVSMFSSASSFNQDISGWNVSNAVYMIGMFSSATAFNQDISGWDVSNVEKMSSMFRWNTAFNQDISGWDTSKVFECLNFASESALEPAHIPTNGPCF